MLVSYEGKVHNLSSTTPPRCEVGKTLQGGDCDLLGTVGIAGLLVCERHARQIEAQDRMALLEGIVSSLKLSLRSIPLRKNKYLSGPLFAQRAQANRELAHAHKDLRRATEGEGVS